MTGVEDILPDDRYAGTLVGRLWVDGDTPGPRTVVVREDGLFDLSALAPTLSDLFDLPDPAAQAARSDGARLGDLSAAVEAAFAGRPGLLAPCDLQAIKAAGVTFAHSLLERVIEERAGGDPRAAADLRATLASALGDEIANVVPGSDAAARLKASLVANSLWSQYLEVGLGPDAEVFTKAQPMSAVGVGAAVGLHPKSEWSNPEPEVVLACSSTGAVVGAALGNDVNLRDFEGRSALLLSAGTTCGAFRFPATPFEGSSS